MTPYAEYQQHLTSLFRPDDTLCFVAINHDTGATPNDFVKFEEAVTPEYFAGLQQLNDKASIYVAMNAYKPELIGKRTGRTEDNVVAIRALYADADRDGDAVLAAMEDSNTVPTPPIILQSSHGKYNVVWPVDNVTKDEAKPILKTIIAEFNTDPAVKDLARILRVPGFVNRKYPDAPPVRVVSSTTVRHVAADFKLVASASSASTPASSAPSISQTYEKYVMPEPGAQITESRNNACKSFAAHIWYFDMTPEELKEKVYKFNQDHCVPPLSESELDSTVLASTVKNKQRKDNEPPVYSGGKLVDQHPDPVVAVVDQEPEIEDVEIVTRPVFPSWVMAGTSIYENLVKPAVETSSKYPELIFMPAVVMALNALAGQVQIKGRNFMPTMFLGTITPPGRFYKSSSNQLAHKYFELVGTAGPYTMDTNTSQGKSLIISIASSEGLGIAMNKANARKAIIYFDELARFVAKAGIENSSFGGDMLTFYEAGHYSNIITGRKSNFVFPAQTYCFSWMWSTTERAFPGLWARLDNISSGLNDRMFFLLSPEEPREASVFIEPDFVEGSKITKALIDKAVRQGVFDYEDRNAVVDIVRGLDPRSIGLIERLALYFAVDLGYDSIEGEALARAKALVDYRIATQAYLDPIEASTKQGKLQQEIVRELKRNGSKMPLRILKHDLHSERHGSWEWGSSFNGLVSEGRILVKDVKTAKGQMQKMVYLLKERD
jgi:hypothetical protein